MTTILANEITFAGRHFPQGTPITPKGAPASGGYFFATAELDGRTFVISVRDIDTVTVVIDEPTDMGTHMDINGTPVRVGNRVEGLDIERNGSMGTVAELLNEGWVTVEWDENPGDAWEHPCEGLRVE